MKRVTYLGPFNSTSTDLRANAEDPNNPASNNVELKGWLYYPSGNNVANRPVVIFNHGHAQERPEPCAVAKYFIRQGFVVFAPLRRGHNSKSNPTFRSTGVHIDYFYEQMSARGEKLKPIGVSDSSAVYTPARPFAERELSHQLLSVKNAF